MKVASSIRHHSVGKFIADAFTRVDPVHLPSAYFTRVEGGAFGCDDYGTLFRTIYGHRRDLMDLFEKANALAVRNGRCAISNQDIAILIESIGIASDENVSTLYKVKLEGFWRAKAPAYTSL